MSPISPTNDQTATSRSVATTRVLVVADIRLHRDAVAGALREDSRFAVVAAVGTADSAISRAGRVAPTWYWSTFPPPTALASLWLSL